MYMMYLNYSSNKVVDVLDHLSVQTCRSLDIQHSNKYNKSIPFLTTHLLVGIMFW